MSKLQLSFGRIHARYPICLYLSTTAVKNGTGWPRGPHGLAAIPRSPDHFLDRESTLWDPNPAILPPYVSWAPNYHSFYSHVLTGKPWYNVGAKDLSILLQIHIKQFVVMPKVGPALSPRPKKIPTESNLAKIENPPPHRSSGWPHLHNRIYPGKEEWIPTCNCSQNSLHQSRTCTRTQFSDLVLVLGWSVLHRAWVNNVRQRTWLKAKMICSATLVAWIVYYVRPR